MYTIHGYDDYKDILYHLSTLYRQIIDIKTPDGHVNHFVSYGYGFCSNPSSVT